MADVTVLAKLVADKVGGEGTDRVQERLAVARRIVRDIIGEPHDGVDPDELKRYEKSLWDADDRLTQAIAILSPGAPKGYVVDSVNDAVDNLLS